MADLQVLPKCPNCGRLTADNAQHCPEKKPALWATNCQWMRCSGSVTTEGRKARCGFTYGPVGWAGFGGAA